MTNIILNRLLFVAEIWIAAFLFAYRLRKRKHFCLRAAAGVVASAGAAIALNIPVESAWVFSLVYIAIFVIIIALMKFCFDELWQNLIFCGIAAYTTQHFAYEFTNLVLTLVTNGVSPLLGTYSKEILDFSNLRWLIFYMAVYAVCYYVSFCLAYFIFGRKIRCAADLKIKNLKLLLLVGVGLLVDVVMNSVFVYSNILQIEQESAVLYSIMMFVYNCLCCILLLTVQFGLVLQRQLKSELDYIRQLWRLRAEQYLVAKENIDIINRKCHDMKHQIRAIGRRHKQIPQDVVDEIEHSIGIYDAAVKTGNDVLDTILTEKSLRCVANKITFSCVADGASISFIKDSDQYALFGNALDNAIEAVLKVKEIEKRVIGLVLYSKKGFITLNINNTVSGNIKMENGLPVTTKPDPKEHGYGVKSIKMIVERYNGEMDMSVDGGVFSLSILIPEQIQTAKTTISGRKNIRNNSDEIR